MVILFAMENPDYVTKQLGSSEFHGIKRENQGSQTDQSSRQECGYAMLTPRTMIIISFKVAINKHLLEKHIIFVKNKLVVDVINYRCCLYLFHYFVFPVYSFSTGFSLRSFKNKEITRQLPGVRLLPPLSPPQ